MKKRKIAFVVPRYGVASAGGAEVLAQKVAERLAAAGNEVTALTTCARDHFTWKNHYRPGEETINGVRVHRFHVDDRGDSREFASIQQLITRGVAVDREDEEAWIQGSVHSAPLYDHIRAHSAGFDCLVFIPYLFGTTWAGSSIAPEKTVLIPCLHDEPFARLGIFAEMFSHARGIIFNSEPERDLAVRLHGLPGDKLAVGGMGLEARERYRPERFRRKFRLDAPFIIYAGRREQGKNTPLLVEYFRLFKKQNPGNDLKLVLLGTGELRIDRSLAGDALDLGYVEEQFKHDGYAASLACCQPSLNESFSIVIMEAWLAGAPCLVHGDCAVTAGHCLRSNGGLTFRDYFHFEDCLLVLLEQAELRGRLAAGGRRYVISEYSWDAIMKKYDEAFEKFGL